MNDQYLPKISLILIINLFFFHNSNAQLFGGQSFSTRSNSQNQYPSGALFCIVTTNIIDITNPGTGKIWMDRNLGALQFPISNSDTSGYGDLYQWGRFSDGHQCRNSSTTNVLSSADQVGNSNFIISTTASPFDWRNPQNNNLWQGVNGINNPCPSGYRIPTETEFVEERLSWIANNSIGAFSSPLKLTLAGNRGSDGIINNTGLSGSYWSCSINGSNSRCLEFNSSSANLLSDRRSKGFSVRCIKELSGTIGALNCGNAVIIGDIFVGQPATGITVNLPYTGGNGGFYSSQNIISSGATGLTASIGTGFFNNGAGNLNFSISGIATSIGNASFIINMGGQSCTLNVAVYPPQPPYPSGSIFCTGSPTIVNDILNPTTGKTWMDRNLGASQTASSLTDINAYGDLYQWGRTSDGHQCRTSPTTTTLSTSDQPGNNNFIRSSGNATTTPFGDWRTPQNTNLWQGASGTNNPCPSGYRIPTDAEMNAEPFNSPIKLTLGGNRTYSSGLLSSVGSNGYYWTSSVFNTNSYYILYTSAGSGKFNNYRASGYSVRCIKN